MEGDASHPDGAGTDLTDENRCWPCTVANATVGLLVAWVPLAATLVNPTPTVVTGAVLWGVVVTGVTGYRLLTRGFLPFAEPAARLTGLHERIGPGTNGRDDHEPENE